MTARESKEFTIKYIDKFMTDNGFKLMNNNSSEALYKRKTILGYDEFGNQWFAIITADGKQIWTQTRANEIINGGLNLIIRTFNPLTGLSQP